MPTLEATLEQIAAGRAADPLAPVTVIVPTRLAGLQLRRGLARLGPFANVRFEVASRVAELVAAADLARSGRRPLARPIGDYVAAVVARESVGPLASVADLPGYARALRQTFRRFRVAGFSSGEDVPALDDGSQLPEIARLFGRWRALTADFYDQEGLLEAAAARLRASPGEVLPELGTVYVVPPARRSAAEATFLDAVRETVPSYFEGADGAAAPETSFIIAPDAASEGRLVVREVVRAFDEGVPLDEIAVFHGDDREYAAILERTFEAAGIPAAAMPGAPLAELAAGRGVLALARLPLGDYRRDDLFDFSALAPVSASAPGPVGEMGPRVSQWRRIAREAGVTHGIGRWRDALALYADERAAALDSDGDMSDARRAMVESEMESARDLLAFVERLHQRLEPLRAALPAREFVPAFLSILADYLDPADERLAAVVAQAEQLGAIDAIGGAFDLASFAGALEANLAATPVRHRSLGQGVLVANYRLAAGLRFRRVFLCGAREGAFPAASETEPLLQDETWSALRELHPYVEDTGTRLERAREAAGRAVAAAAGGILTWSCPLQSASGRRDFYPSPLMVEAARRRFPSIVTATDLRSAPASEGLLRAPSPLAAMVAGPVIDRREIRLREAIIACRDSVSLPPGHPIERAAAMLRARRSAQFTEFDGNLSALGARLGIAAGRPISPTTLESYAACGFRHFLSSILRLKGVEEPEEAQVISPLERGTLVHRALEFFFVEARATGRPQPNERWTGADAARLIEIFEDEYARLHRLGRLGLAVHAESARRLLRSDLAAFLEADSAFRAEAGAVPHSFEQRLPPVMVEGVTLTGRVDRIDLSPDGSRAWVIDYKTGSAASYKKDSEDPLAGGTHLQLPVYALAPTGAAVVEAFYWFVGSGGSFERVSYTGDPDNRARFQATVAAIRDGIAAGSFPAIPGEENSYYGGFANCGFCDFKHLCSGRRDREFEQKSGDPAVVPWRQVAIAARGEDAE